MATYLFVTKPEFTPELVESGECKWWSCSSKRRKHDLALVYVTGIGITYEWELVTDSSPDDEWGFVCNVKYLRTHHLPITCAELKKEFSTSEWGAPHTNFRGHKSILIPEAIASRIRCMRGRK